MPSSPASAHIPSIAGADGNPPRINKKALPLETLPHFQGERFFSHLLIARDRIAGVKPALRHLTGDTVHCQSIHILKEEHRVSGGFVIDA